MTCDHVNFQIDQYADNAQHIQADADDIAGFGVEFDQNGLTAAGGLVELAFNDEALLDVMIDVIGNGDDVKFGNFGNVGPRNGTIFADDFENGQIFSFLIRENSILE